MSPKVTISLALTSVYVFAYFSCPFFFYSDKMFLAAANDKKLPVIVFLHGESFEWNSGNPYDGTVLASYGELVVVTLNYRLGILGENIFTFLFLYSRKKSSFTIDLYHCFCL